MDSVFVSEICPSIMGELPLQGHPCVILRLAGCSLRCGYCDTPYALEVRPSRDRRLPIDQVIEEVKRFGLSLVLLTGGEPMDQRSTPELIRELLSCGYRVVLETNGAIELASVPEEVVKVVDVKCPGSGEGDSFLPANLKSIGSRDWMKFVLSDRDDYLWSLDFLGSHDLGGAGILFSPVHGTLDPGELAAWMLEDRVAAHLNLQIHKIIGMP